jgi:hypothetical protein
VTPRLRLWSGPTGCLLFGLAAAVSSPAFAQEPRDLTREGFSVAIMWTAQLHVGQTVSARFSTGGRKVGFDVDLGWVVKRAKLRPVPPQRKSSTLMFRWVPTGLVVDAHVRWMPWKRRETGWGTGIVWGVRFVQGRLFDEKDVALGTYWTKGSDLGLAIDRVNASGSRFGIEFANSTTMSRPPQGQRILELGGPSVYFSFFGGWLR